MADARSRALLLAVVSTFASPAQAGGPAVFRLNVSEVAPEKKGESPAKPAR